MVADQQRPTFRTATSLLHASGVTDFLPCFRFLGTWIVAAAECLMRLHKPRVLVPTVEPKAAHALVATRRNMFQPTQQESVGWQASHGLSLSIAPFEFTEAVSKHNLPITFLEQP